MRAVWRRDKVRFNAVSKKRNLGSGLPCLRSKGKRQG
jgi:hypothetical protein